MKVSIVHPERRTSQTILLEALGGRDLPRELDPTQRHELTLAPGERVVFIAGVRSPDLGSVALLLEIEASLGELLPVGCCIGYCDADADVPPVQRHTAPLTIELQPGRNLGIVVGYPLASIADVPIADLRFADEIPERIEPSEGEEADDLDALRLRFEHALVAQMKAVHAVNDELQVAVDRGEQMRNDRCAAWANYVFTLGGLASVTEELGLALLAIEEEQALRTEVEALHSEIIGG